MTEFFDAPPESTRQSRRSTRGHRIWHTLRVGLVLLVVAAFVTFAGTLAWPHVRDVFIPEKAADYSGTPGKEVLVAIPEGSTGAQMADVLLKAGVVASKQAFVDAFTANPRSNSIQPGTYYLKTHISAADAVTALLDPAARAEYTVTIPEGFTTAAIYEKIANVFKLNVNDVTKQAKDVQAIGLPAEAKGNLEGWLAPGQYIFMPDTSVVQALKQMVANRVKELEASGIARDQWQRQLTIASIAEKEVSNPDDLPKVARTIENRLNEKLWPEGLLKVDSSVLYGLGKSLDTATSEDYKKDTPYNTYIHPGLPPTPICNPGIAVVKATVNPPAGNWLYWVTVNLDTGETHFSTTLDEHEKYAKQFQEWYAKNRPAEQESAQ
ncbi:MAG: endolytic transglycosylase MltG [Actinomycetaceae bacterium]|nr:endolytic transglycosylase MltG [Arcanobacterium sp.]MDD7686427.1 endolytic transglycosylase MltG [Actinomycetaceae bacterium]MDY5272707.1 endolytic transglycosylase MltG [Arcanobacterium sp.]